MTKKRLPWTSLKKQNPQISPRYFPFLGCGPVLCQKIQIYSLCLNFFFFFPSSLPSINLHAYTLKSVEQQTVSVGVW